ncbi:MAG: hypothetical protein KC442_04200 [Thermomicrobiales bacterium]|nr:hypothetical protein [Thermomicrobiales bacterium]
MGRAGFAKVRITPPLGVELAGYGVYLGRRSTQVRDELFARALVLEDDAGERVLLLSLDLLGLSWDLYRDVTASAANAAGLDPTHALVSSTHTHSGPSTASLGGFGEADAAYLATLPGLGAEAAAAAIANLHPVRLGTSHGSVQTLGFNRVRSDGPIDRGLHVLRVDSPDGAPEVVVFSLGVHPVSIDRRTAAGTAISGDWPARVGKRLADEGYPETIFCLGPCGDIDPVVAWRNFDFQGLELSAELVTQSLLGVLPDVATVPNLTLRLARQNLPLPLAPLTEEVIAATLGEAQTKYGSMTVTDSGVDPANWTRFYAEWAADMRAQLATQPQDIAAPVAALRINDAVWLFLPGEIFTALAQAIAEQSPYTDTVATTIFGPFIGYIPDREDFAAGGYASTLVPRVLRLPPYSPAVGETLVAGTLALIASLEG